MTPFVAPLFFVAVQAAGASVPATATAAAQAAAAQTAPGTPSGTPAGSSAGTSAGDDAEARDVAVLRNLESKIAVGVAPTGDDLATVKALLEGASAPRARASAAAVLAWFDPATAAPVLVRATGDGDGRVRAAAVQALVALVRRLPAEQASGVVNAGISLLDDAEDEVACAAAELLAALDPPGARQAFEVRGATASDVRYACYVRFAGLPVRTVYLPPLPAPPVTKPSSSPESPGRTSASATDAAPTNAAPTNAAPTNAAPTNAAPMATEPPNWIFVASAAGAGLLAGAALPSAIVPARDVLVYDDDASRVTRQEVSLLTQAVGGLVGAALLGSGAWGGERLFGQLDDAEAIAFSGGAGAGATLGAGLGLMVGADDAGQALALSLGTLAGVATGAGAVFGATLTAEDNALVLSSAALGTLGGALVAFTAIPVGVDAIGTAQRSDIGLGAGLAGAGALALLATGVAPFVEVKGQRLAAITAGGLAGGGLLTALGFLVVPNDLNVASRVACGMGLVGEIAGAALAGALLPDAWLVQPVDVAVLGHDVAFGTPTLTALSPLPGSTVVPLAAVVSGRF